MTNHEQYYIATSTDEKYYVPMYVMLLSLFENNIDAHLHVSILHKNLTDEQKNEIELLAARYNNSINWLRVNSNEPSEFYISEYITEASYYRLYLPELLPQNVEKVLYLDSDIIINGSILPLLDSELNDAALAAVKEAKPFKPERLGIHAPYDYFNAGVLLLNLATWREHNYAATLKNNIKRNPSKYPMHDQDLLNEFFHKQVHYLHPKWNHQTALYGSNITNSENRYGISITELCGSPVIIHFTGWLKPWLYINTHPLKPLFLKYLNQTPYATFAEKGTPGLWIKKMALRLKHKIQSFL